MKTCYSRKKKKDHSWKKLQTYDLYMHLLFSRRNKLSQIDFLFIKSELFSLMGEHLGLLSLNILEFDVSNNSSFTSNSKILANTKYSTTNSRFGRKYHRLAYLKLRSVNRDKSERFRVYHGKLLQFTTLSVKFLVKEIYYHFPQ
jgi:hypothetical protein